MDVPDPENSAAVLIGVSRFDDERLVPLPGVTNNVTDLAEIFRASGGLGLAADRCPAILDPGHPAALLDPLDRLCRSSTDTLIVYYAGHGLLTPNGELVLSTRTANRDVPETGVRYAAVRDVLRRSRAHRKVVVLDCCFSGRALYAMSDPATAVIGQVDVEGTYVLTSSPSTSTSIAPLGARYTAFTGGVLDILRNGVPGGDEVLTLNDIYDHVVLAMTRRGWPCPQRFGTNSVARLRLLRNRAWQRIAPRPVPGPPVDLDRHRSIAAGVREAVAIVSAGYGRPDRDGLAELERVRPRAAGGPESARSAGVELVRETMRTVRQQYGDGATTAAVILGRLVAGLDDLLAGGAAPERLTVVGLEGIRVGDHLHQLASEDGDDLITEAVRCAVGTDEAGGAVAAAVRAVGAGNVEVAQGSAATADGQAGSFVLETEVISPNGLNRPRALERPMVVVSPDGELDVDALIAASGTARPNLLIIAPRVSIYALRGLLHSYAQIVVVRPSDPSLDLNALRTRFGNHGARSGWGLAARVLVLPDATTIDRPAADLALTLTRVSVPVVGKELIEQAARALAVARAASEAGVVADAAAALRRAAAAYQPLTSSSAQIGELVRAAASEPDRVLAERSGPAPVTPLITVRGALHHAVAGAGRFLAGA